MMFSARGHVADEEHGWMSNAPQQQGGGVRSPQLGRLGNLGGTAGAGFTRWILIGVVVILLVCAGFTVLLVTLNNMSNPTATPPPATTLGNAGAPGGAGNGTVTIVGLNLGQVIMTSAIDSANRPAAVTDTFTTASPAIYAVVPGINVPAGSTLFARWLRDGTLFEDSPAITAPEAYTNTFIQFVLQPKAGATFQPGAYTVQIFGNGVQRAAAQFTVR
jgi:hypothetical protein